MKMTLPTTHAARRWAAPFLVAATLLTACGGGGEDRTETPALPVPPISPERAGRLESAEPLGSVPAADIAAALAAKESLAQGVVPRYGVVSYRLEYLTTDSDGREVRASGLASVPLKPAGAKSPVLSYQHGSIFQDAEAPSNHAVASEVAVVLASQYKEGL